MNIVSLFSGAGGLDLGFESGGFHVFWANEFDKDIWETYEKNFPETYLDRRSITDVSATDLPDCDGIIGGPPCQSWSAAGSLRGINDKRGQLFYDYTRILKEKQPKFFLAENVPGMLSGRHAEALTEIKKTFEKCGYDLHVRLLNAKDYGVPQDRKRVFFIGFRKDLKVNYRFPTPLSDTLPLSEAIKDLEGTEVPSKGLYESNVESCHIPNHEYLTGGFSSMYMSRNRVRSWSEPSFTIQAGGRHAPLHPQAPKMVLTGKDKRQFVRGHEHLYRRLTVRECARIQSFPDTHIFHYQKVLAGYKMVGNAVPCRLAECIATSVLDALKSANHSVSFQSSAHKILTHPSVTPLEKISDNHLKVKLVS